VKEDPDLVANGRFQCLVANGRFQCLVPMEGSNTWWPMEGKGKGKGKGEAPFHLFSLSPNKFYLNLHFFH